MRFQLDDSQGALADCNQAIYLDPRSAVVYNNRGGLKEDKLNDPQGALADYNQAIAIAPEDAEAHHNRGILKQGMNNRLGAINDSRAAVKFYRQQGQASNLQNVLDLLRELGAKE